MILLTEGSNSVGLFDWDIKTNKRSDNFIVDSEFSFSVVGRETFGDGNDSMLENRRSSRRTKAFGDRNSRQNFVFARRTSRNDKRWRKTSKSDRRTDLWHRNVFFTRRDAEIEQNRLPMFSTRRRKRKVSAFRFSLRFVGFSGNFVRFDLQKETFWAKFDGFSARKCRSSSSIWRGATFRVFRFELRIPRWFFVGKFRQNFRFDRENENERRQIVENDDPESLQIDSQVDRNKSRRNVFCSVKTKRKKFDTAKIVSFFFFRTLKVLRTNERQDAVRRLIEKSKRSTLRVASIFHRFFVETNKPTEQNENFLEFFTLLLENFADRQIVFDLVDIFQRQNENVRPKIAEILRKSAEGKTSSREKTERIVFLVKLFPEENDFTLRIYRSVLENLKNVLDDPWVLLRQFSHTTQFTVIRKDALLWITKTKWATLDTIVIS